MSTVRFEMSMTTENHGCNRLAREGDDLPDARCDDASCIDCAAHDLVAKFAPSVDFATLTHWPDDPRLVVVDDLHSRVRMQGRFSASRDLMDIIKQLEADGADGASIERLRAIAASI